MSEQDPQSVPPFKARPMPSMAIGIDALEQRGCGAWVSNHSCGATPTDLVIGQLELYFATYRNAVDPKSATTYAFLCARHNPANGAQGTTADMRPDILRSQRRELRKAFKQQGRTLGKPNLLEPGNGKIKVERHEPRNADGGSE